MAHVEAISAVLEQFDSYKSNCVSCEKEVDGDCGRPDCVRDMDEICEDKNTVCREKLEETARELDE